MSFWVCGSLFLCRANNLLTVLFVFLIVCLFVFCRKTCQKLPLYREKTKLMIQQKKLYRFLACVYTEIKNNTQIVKFDTQEAKCQPRFAQPHTHSQPHTFCKTLHTVFYKTQSASLHQTHHSELKAFCVYG